MSMGALVVEGIRVPLREIAIGFVRSSGPGGQRVNKANTKAVLRWPVASSQALPAAVRQRFLARFAKRITSEGALIMASDRYRDQGRNTADCLEKLRAMIAAVANDPRPRHATRPTTTSRERRLEDKRRRSALKLVRSSKVED
jgi:ribosome-associated protein